MCHTWTLLSFDFEWTYCKKLTRIDGFFEIFKKTLSNRRKICTKAALRASFAHSARGKMNCMYLYVKTNIDFGKKRSNVICYKFFCLQYLCKPLQAIVSGSYGDTFNSECAISAKRIWHFTSSSSVFLLSFIDCFFANSVKRVDALLINSPTTDNKTSLARRKFVRIAWNDYKLSTMQCSSK